VRVLSVPARKVGRLLMQAGGAAASSNQLLAHDSPCNRASYLGARGALVGRGGPALFSFNPHHPIRSQSTELARLGRRRGGFETPTGGLSAQRQGFKDPVP